jgi:hypothetical protein
MTDFSLWLPFCMKCLCLVRKNALLDGMIESGAVSGRNALNAAHPDA